MTAVTIPAGLSADVAAHPERYRPLVPRYAHVLTLRGGIPREGEVMSSGAPIRGVQPWIALRDDKPGTPTADAWALVGSVDGGPRPAVGDRVLVRRADGVGETGTVENYQDDGRIGVVLDGTSPGLEVLIPADWWAILPPLPDPAEGGGSTETADPGPEVHQRPEPAPDGWDRAHALDELAAGRVPAGTWRPGGHCPRNLWIGPPRPHGVDVGRMDSPTLAQYVCDAVNDRDELRGRLLALEAERNRYQAALERVAQLDPARPEGAALAHKTAREALAGPQPPGAPR